MEKNEEIFRRWIEEGWNRGKPTVVEELFAPDYVSHASPLNFPPNQEGMRRGVRLGSQRSGDI